MGLRTPIDSTFSSRGPRTIQIFENVDIIQIFARFHLLLRVDHPRYLSALRKGMFSNHVLTPYPVLNPITIPQYSTPSLCRFALVCTEKISIHTGKAEINQTMQRLDVFFYRSLKIYSTNILIHLVTQNLMFLVLCLNRGGVSSSKLVL